MRKKNTCEVADGGSKRKMEAQNQKNKKNQALLRKKERKKIKGEMLRKKEEKK